jgi:hypothetical protein
LNHHVGQQRRWHYYLCPADVIHLSRYYYKLKPKDKTSNINPLSTDDYSFIADQKICCNFLRLLGQQVEPELLVKSGEDFIRTCTVRMDNGLNVTCTLPSSGGSPTDTATHRQNEAALFLRKVLF